MYRSRFQTTNRQRNIKGDTNEAVTSGQGAVARLTENATLIMALAVAYSSQFYILEEIVVVSSFRGSRYLVLFYDCA